MNVKLTAAGVARVAVTLILTTCISTHVVAQEKDADKHRAQALWEEAIKAKGGRERLHSVENLLISSTKNVHIPREYDVKTTTTETERLYVMPEKAWIYELTPHSMCHLRRN